MRLRMTINLLFSKLLAAYGPQGWWPLISQSNLDGRDSRGYLPSSYGIPEPEDAFEIAVGAILTQNTSWINAERAVQNLSEAGRLSVPALLSCEPEELSELIRPAGYYNVKARKLKRLSEFFQSLASPSKLYRTPGREELLSVWGVGPETADSILLYAFAFPSFVIDAYTRRIVGRLGVLSPDLPYEDMRQAFETELAKDVPVFNEFHALLVEHAKRHCKSKPDCSFCCLSPECSLTQKDTLKT